MIGAHSRFVKSSTFIIDMLLVHSSVIVSMWLRFGGHIPMVNWDAYVHISIALTVIAGTLWWLLGFYDNPITAEKELTSQAVVSCVGMFIAVSVTAYFYQHTGFPRMVAAIACVIEPFLFLVWRATVSAVFRRSLPYKSVLLVTDGKPSYELLTKIEQEDRSRYRLKAACTVSQLLDDIEAMASFDTILIDAYIPASTRSQLVLEGLAYGREVLVIPDTYDIVLQRVLWGRIADAPVFRIDHLRLSRLQSTLKRILDIVVCIPALALFLLVLPIIAVAITATSKGKIFYSQERVGQNGKLIRIFKFRTMLEGAEKETGPVLASSDDPRVTVVGRFLRSTRLDELPQVINVLIGDMSIVGPRPERPEFVAEFIQTIPQYEYRHHVKPGITGYAQVYGEYVTTANDKLRYDLMYIRSYSLAHDIQLIFQTIAVTLRPEKAQGIRKAASEKERQKGDRLMETWRQIAASREGM